MEDNRVPSALGSSKDGLVVIQQAIKRNQICWVIEIKNLTKTIKQLKALLENKIGWQCEYEMLRL